MSKRFVLVVVAVVVFLALLGALTARNGLLGSSQKTLPELVEPGPAGIEESASGQEETAELGMPVPGFADTPEMIVVGEEDSSAESNGMPVPGFEGVPEMIVIEE